MVFSFIFPGQGISSLGSSESWVSDDLFKGVVYEAGEILSLDISDIKELFISTHLGIFIRSIALFRAFVSKGLSPTMIAGLSMGECTAMVASGIVSFEDGLRLLDIRRKLLMKYLPRGGMSLVTGLERQDIERCGFQIAVSYTKNRFVISGLIEELKRAKIELTRWGGRVVALPINIPYHSSHMDCIASQFLHFVEGISLEQGQISLVSNLTGGLLRREDVKKALVSHFTSEVRWGDTLSYMKKYCKNIYEVGDPQSTHIFNDVVNLPDLSSLRLLSIG